MSLSISHSKTSLNGRLKGNLYWNFEAAHLAVWYKEVELVMGYETLALLECTDSVTL